jgi:CRP-like cAMP-binding protein
MRPRLLSRSDRRTPLSGVAAFAGYDPRTVAPLARHADRLRVPAGTLIARAGQAAREAVLVLAGDVAVITAGGVERRGPGTWVGADQIPGRGRHPATVVAGADLEVLVLPAPAFRWALQVLPGLVAGARGPATGDGPGGDRLDGRSDDAPADRSALTSS